MKEPVTLKKRMKETVLANNLEPDLNENNNFLVYILVY
jgi:hypothetical protein